MLLAGDIGGTKTSLAVYSADSGPRTPLYQATFPSGRYPNLQSLVREFLSQVAPTVDRAAFGVAGPVVAGQATVTNLPWVIDEAELKQEFSLSSVKLLNDLQAIANGIPSLKTDDLLTLSAGQPEARGVIAVIAPGTGLGEAFLTWDSGSYQPRASEGGHTDFGPSNELQAGLLHYLSLRLDHVSYERVCSGIGLPNIYAYLKDSGYAEEPEWLAQELATADDPTPVIVGAALAREKTCPLCVATLDMFVSILGAEAGNLTLKVLATGGVYVAGGIARRILSKLRGSAFLAAFRSKGRFSDLLLRIPVHVVLHPQVALLGVARYGLEL